MVGAESWLYLQQTYRRPVALVWPHQAGNGSLITAHRPFTQTLTLTPTHPLPPLTALPAACLPAEPHHLGETKQTVNHSRQPRLRAGVTVDIYRQGKARGGRAGAGEGRRRRRVRATHVVLTALCVRVHVCFERLLTWLRGEVQSSLQH